MTRTRCYEYGNLNEDFEVVGEAFDDGAGNTFSQQTTTNEDGSYTVVTTSESSDTQVSSTFNYDLQVN